MRNYYKAITALGWHPFLRVNRQGQFRPKGQAHPSHLRPKWPPRRAIQPSMAGSGGEMSGGVQR